MGQLSELAQGSGLIPPPKVHPTSTVVPRTIVLRNHELEQRRSTRPAVPRGGCCSLLNLPLSRNQMRRLRATALLLIGAGPLGACCIIPSKETSRERDVEKILVENDIRVTDLRCEIPGNQWIVTEDPETVCCFKADAEAEAKLRSRSAESLPEAMGGSGTVLGVSIGSACFGTPEYRPYSVSKEGTEKLCVRFYSPGQTLG